MQIDMDKLVELGASLKAKRREKGLEREEVAIKIKVSPKTLHALEEAIPDSLPQPVFAKGFARSYAEALGFKADEAAALIGAAFPAEFADNINPDLTSAAREQSISINQTSNAKIYMVVVPILVLVLAVVGWFAYKAFSSKDSTPPPPPPQQVRPAAVPQPAPAAVSSPAGDAGLPPAAGPEAAPAAGATPGAAEQSAAPATAQPPAAEAAPARPQLNLPPNQAPQSNALANSPIPSGMKRVVLFAKYECWVGAEFDEIGRRSFTLEAGQTFVLDFKNRLTLTLGNSGAVDMSYNGKPYDLGGRFREAKVLNFPPR